MTDTPEIARIRANFYNDEDACNPTGMAVLLAHIDAQAAEIERLWADAARYRWLRKTTNFVTSKTERIDVSNQPELWDEAIDSAIKGATP